MRTLTTALCIIFSLSTFGNVHHIHFDKIPDNLKYKKHIDFLIDNEPFLNHWTQSWNYPISKDSLIKELKVCYDTFSKIDINSIELKLLLGDIAHYLYNLEENSFNDSAINSYLTATKIDSTDYRPYWFLATHYCMSAEPEKSIVNFIKAKRILPKDTPAIFWEEYAYATAIANMPSTSIYAMDKAKQIAGKPSNFETQIGKTVYSRLIQGNADLNYVAKDLWYAQKGHQITLISRPLGLMVSIDSTWQPGFNDYKNYQTALILRPPRLKNKNSIAIGFTIMILCKVNNGSESLNTYLQTFISGFADKKKIDFSEKYDNIIAYDLNNKMVYPNYGGGHFLIVGIQRSCPHYPGMVLENPISLPTNNNDKGVAYYMPNSSINRFKQKIMYVMIMDSCEDIYPESSKIFKDWFEKQLIIE